MATVITTIGLRSVENVNISSVIGSGPEYTVTLTATVPSETDVGDRLEDEAGSQNTYLITEIAGSTLTVVDSTGVGAAPDSSETSTAFTARYYGTVGGWVTGIVVGDLYASDADVVGHLMNDGAMAEDEIFINTDVVNSIRLTAPEDERHDGSPGTGARIEAPGGASYIIGTKKTVFKELSWIELDGNLEAVSYGVRQNQNTDDPPDYHHMLVYDGGARWGGAGIILTGSGHGLRATRCMVWNWSYRTVNGLPGYDSVGIDSANATSARRAEIVNCTVWSITHGGIPTGYGISTPDHANKVVVNNVVMGCDSDLELDAPSSADYRYNCTSDDTASGTGALPDKITADNFYGLDPVDLHLKDANADCVDEGVDLGTTTYEAVELDIDGRNVDSEADTWDIGADEFVSEVTGNPWNYYAQQGGV